MNTWTTNPMFPHNALISFDDTCAIQPPFFFGESAMVLE